MSADSQNMAYYYPQNIHLGSQQHAQIPYYGATAQAFMSSQYGRYNQIQDINDNGLIYSQNYCYQPPSYSKNSLNQLNIGSAHGFCQNDDHDGNQVRSRGNSINFMPIASANLDDNNFYPQNGQDQIVSSNFNEMHIYNVHLPQQNGQPLINPHMNYHMEDLIGSSTILQCNIHDMQYPYNYQQSFSHLMYNPVNQYNHNYPTYQNAMQSQPYLMSDISNITPQVVNPTKIQNYQNINLPTSLQNLSFEAENAQILNAQEEKQQNIVKATDYSKVIQTPQSKSKKKGKAGEISKNVIQNENDPSIKSPSHSKSTEKLKKKYANEHPKKQDVKVESLSNDENTPVLPTLLVKRNTSEVCRSKKSKNLSEATTNFEPYSELNTPTNLKQNSYKKIKIEEKDGKVKSSTSADQPSTKTSFSEHSILSPPKNSLLSLPQEKLIEIIKNIMKTLPPAYLPFMHKKLSDSQKLEYIKKNHQVPSQNDLNKIKQLLPSNFSDVFNVNIDQVYQNTFIMNGVFQNIPDESQKKIGTLTRKERREKINKYKVKRDKRANSFRKISYDVRKRVADSRLRVKGRFVTKEQALHMIGDFSGEIDKYTNQELRELLIKKFCGENSDRLKKFPLDCDENNNQNKMAYDDEDIDSDEDDQDEDEI
ncbi:hypothetical protein ABPG72_017873 [Tetrahymena utriculariae]